ncbi:hypothetical protein LCGC14_0264680 [marine sediment metagenome]|uniref:Uncharacterized protein n=1 Tax=marine sediment metagenome TaxID=412755 RepID=A0A0F9U105_9ZZZZ
MPTYEFKCDVGKEMHTLKLSVVGYVNLKDSPDGVFCLEHKSKCKRVFNTFSFRM